MHHQNRRKEILAVILTFCLIYVLCRLYSLVNPLERFIEEHTVGIVFEEAGEKIGNPRK